MRQHVAIEIAIIRLLLVKANHRLKGMRTPIVFVIGKEVQGIILGCFIIHTIIVLPFFHRILGGKLHIGKPKSAGIKLIVIVFAVVGVLARDAPAGQGLEN